MQLPLTGLGDFSHAFIFNHEHIRNYCLRNFRLGNRFGMPEHSRFCVAAMPPLTPSPGLRDGRRRRPRWRRP